MTQEPLFSDSDSPPLGQLADENDTAGWDREQHGTFAEHATDDGEIETVDPELYLRKFGPVNGAR